MDSIYNTLLSLPLFQGLTYASISGIVETTPLHFEKYRDGEFITTPDQNDNSLLFVLSGRAVSELTSPENIFTFTQTIAAPQLIEVERLFGLYTNRCTQLTAKGDTGVLRIDKEAFKLLLQQHPIILLNYCNILSRKAQAQITALEAAALPAEEKILFWRDSLSYPGATDVRLAGKGYPLDQLFRTDAAKIKLALQSLKESGQVVGYNDYSIQFSN